MGKPHTNGKYMYQWYRECMRAPSLLSLSCHVRGWCRAGRCTTVHGKRVTLRLLATILESDNQKDQEAGAQVRLIRSGAESSVWEKSSARFKSASINRAPIDDRQRRSTIRGDSL